MILTAQALFNSEVVNIGSLTTIYNLDTFADFFYNTVDYDTGIVVPNQLKIRAGFPVRVLSAGLATDHGIVNGVDNTLSLAMTNDISPIVFYNSILPFLPNEYSIGKDIIVQSENTGTGGMGAIFQGFCKGEISTLGLPDELIGTAIAMSLFIKIEVDERAVI